MANVSVRREGSTVAVETPYHPTWPPSARSLGGRWDPDRRVWRFDARDEERVRALIAELFGNPDEPRVTVRIKAEGLNTAYVGSFFAMGREILSRRGRDAEVQLGEGVVLLAGGYPASAGSRQNPAIGRPLEGTILEVRDVPLSLARRACQANAAYSIIDPAADRRVALETEAASLRRRLAEVEAELAALSSAASA